MSQASAIITSIVKILANFEAKLTRIVTILENYALVSIWLLLMSITKIHTSIEQVNTSEIFHFSQCGLFIIK